VGSQGWQAVASMSISPKAVLMIQLSHLLTAPKSVILFVRYNKKTIFFTSEMTLCTHQLSTAATESDVLQEECMSIFNISERMSAFISKQYKLLIFLQRKLQFLKQASMQASCQLG
jgi:hypothetical protein